MRQPIVRWTLTAVACLGLCIAPAVQAAPESAEVPAVSSWLEVLFARIAEELPATWAGWTSLVEPTEAAGAEGDGEGRAEALGGTCDPGSTEHGCSIDPDG